MELPAIITEIKEIAVIANFILFPVLLLLWKIDKKLAVLQIWATQHETLDTVRFKATEERLVALESPLVKIHPFV